MSTTSNNNNINILEELKMSTTNNENNILEELNMSTNKKYLLVL